MLSAVPKAYDHQDLPMSVNIRYVDLNGRLRKMNPQIKSVMDQFGLKPENFRELVDYKDPQDPLVGQFVDDLDYTYQRNGKAYHENFANWLRFNLIPGTIAGVNPAYVFAFLIFKALNTKDGDLSRRVTSSANLTGVESRAKSKQKQRQAESRAKAHQQSFPTNPEPSQNQTDVRSEHGHSLENEEVHELPTFSFKDSSTNDQVESEAKTSVSNVNPALTSIAPTSHENQVSTQDPVKPSSSVSLSNDLADRIDNNLDIGGMFDLNSQAAAAGQNTGQTSDSNHSNSEMSQPSSKAPSRVSNEFNQTLASSTTQRSERLQRDVVASEAGNSQIDEQQQGQNESQIDFQDDTTSVSDIETDDKSSNEMATINDQINGQNVVEKNTQSEIDMEREQDQQTPVYTAQDLENLTKDVKDKYDLGTNLTRIPTVALANGTLKVNFKLDDPRTSRAQLMSGVYPVMRQMLKDDFNESEQAGHWIDQLSNSDVVMTYFLYNACKNQQLSRRLFERYCRAFAVNGLPQSQLRILRNRTDLGDVMVDNRLGWHCRWFLYLSYHAPSVKRDAMSIVQNELERLNDKLDLHTGLLAGQLANYQEDAWPEMLYGDDVKRALSTIDDAHDDIVKPIQTRNRTRQVRNRNRRK